MFPPDRYTARILSRSVAEVGWDEDYHVSILHDHNSPPLTTFADEDTRFPSHEHVPK